MSSKALVHVKRDPQHRLGRTGRPQFHLNLAPAIQAVNTCGRKRFLNAVDLVNRVEQKKPADGLPAR